MRLPRATTPTASPLHQQSTARRKPASWPPSAALPLVNCPLHRTMDQRRVSRARLLQAPSVVPSELPSPNSLSALLGDHSLQSRTQRLLTARLPLPSARSALPRPPRAVAHYHEPTPTRPSKQHPLPPQPLPTPPVVSSRRLHRFQKSASPRPSGYAHRLEHQKMCLAQPTTMRTTRSLSLPPSVSAPSARQRTQGGPTSTPRMRATRAWSASMSSTPSST